MHIVTAAISSMSNLSWHCFSLFLFGDRESFFIGTWAAERGRPLSGQADMSLSRTNLGQGERVRTQEGDGKRLPAFLRGKWTDEIIEIRPCWWRGEGAGCGQSSYPSPTTCPSLFSSLSFTLLLLLSYTCSPEQILICMYNHNLYHVKC